MIKDKLLIADALKTKNTAVVAQEFGISEASAKAIARQAGIKPPRKVKVERTAFEQYIHHNLSKAHYEVASHFNVSVATVNKLLKDCGLTLPKKRKPYSFKKIKVKSRILNVVAQLLLTDKSQSAISQELGVARQYVGQVCEQIYSLGLFDLKQSQNKNGNTQ